MSREMSISDLVIARDEKVGELLDALELLCGELEVSLPDQYGDLNLENIWSAYRNAKAAIAKANGERP